MLFNTTTDDLEDASEDLEEPSDEESEDFSTPQSSTPANRSAAPDAGLLSPVVPVRRKTPRRLVEPGEGGVAVPTEVNHWTEARWKPHKVKVRKFIDDGVSGDKINFENSYGFEVNGTNYRVKHPFNYKTFFGISSGGPKQKG